MQTFLPYADFNKCAQVLDRQRLGKQRVEALQILQTLTGESSGWANHPAVKMWAGAEYYLYQYAIAICDEWISRGYKDTCKQKIKDIMSRHKREWSGRPPSWLHMSALHTSHQSNLVRKFPEHYAPLFGNIPNDLPYVWPV